MLVIQHMNRKVIFIFSLVLAALQNNLVYDLNFETIQTKAIWDPFDFHS